MGRSKDSTSHEELHRMLPTQSSSFPDFAKYCERSDSISNSSSNSSTVENALWNEDFSHRPSWCDAGLAYQQIKKGRAHGNKLAIRLRALLQRFLFRLGCVIQRHFEIVLVVGALLLITSAVGLRQMSIETNIEKLWVERGGRLDKERAFIRGIFSLQAGLGAADDGGLSGGSNSAQYLVLIQTPKQKGLNILAEEELLLHADVLKNVAQLTVDMYGEKWQLSDICFKPPPPNIESPWGSMVTNLLDRIIPCVIITPLDCFWEGSIPLGPFPPMFVPEEVTMFISSLHGRLNWKNLDPAAVIADAADVIGDSESFKNFFLRAGVDRGYLNRPCLDPLDPECPPLAPNYLDICHVVEKYLLFTNRSIIYDQPTTRIPLFGEPRFVNDISSTHRNGTTNGTLSMSSSTSADGLLLDFLGTNWSSTQSWTQETEESTTMFSTMTQQTKKKKLKISHELCKQYENDVRRMAKTDKIFLRRIGIEMESINLGQDLTGGCKGFAEKFMQWPEDLIVGGVKHQSDQIVKAEALQSVLMISSPSEIYHRFKQMGTKPSLNMDLWTYNAADKVLKAWQRKYTDYIYNYVNNTGQGDRRLHPLAGTSVNDMLAEFSKFNPTVLIVGYVLMIFYAGMSLCSCADRGIRSSVGLAVSGCLMVTIASVAGLGFAMWIGIKLNAATTQIVPFLTLGLGVDDMFLLVHNYKEIVKYVHHDEIGFLLKETGLSALLTSINNIVAFMAGAVMPVPALRDFCLQVAILLCFNAVTVLTLFPAVMTVDLDRRKRRCVDIFCCFSYQNDKVQPKDNEGMKDCENGDAGSRSTGDGVNSNMTETTLVGSNISIVSNEDGVGKHDKTKGSLDRPNYQRMTTSNSIRHQCGIQHWTLHRFVKDFYNPLLSKRRFKAFVILFHCVLFGLGMVGFTRIDLGLELTDVIPKGTAPYAFLAARESYFSFYPFNIIIQGPTDYPHQQRLIRDLRKDVAKISYVVKNNDGRLSEESWLDMMAKWLAPLQAKLDQDMHDGHINLSGIVRNDVASSDGKLAFKLLCNEGDILDCSKVGTKKLVDIDGLIEPDGFYNYLTAWFHSDPLTYYISQANFYPTPPVWNNDEHRHKQEVPPAHAMEYSQIPFFATGLVDTPAVVDMIRQVRNVCDSYVERGLPVFPEGIPFTFWEQYLHLWRYLAIALGTITAAVFIIVTVLLVNGWIAVIIVLVLALMVVELAGFMGMTGLKLNPVSSVTLITAVGIGVEFTVHVSLSFLTALGTRNERMAHTLEHMFIPVLHGGLSTLLGVIMLAFSEFEFVVRYFFMVLSALIVLGLLNGLLLLPVLLSLIGPKSEVRPTDGTNRLAPPTPPPKRRPIPPELPTVTNGDSHIPSVGVFPRQSDMSLSTIAEEPSPPSSATPPTGASADGATITLEAMKFRLSEVDSPMTLTAKTTVELQVVPGASPASNNRRATFASKDAPPPYVHNPKRNRDQDNENSRRRNRSADNTPSQEIPTVSSGLRKDASSRGSTTSTSSTFSPTPPPRKQSKTRRRAPSDSSSQNTGSSNDTLRVVRL